MSLEFDYSNLEKELLQEINNLRQNPKEYIKRLENEISLIKDDIIYRPNEVPLKLEEGINAYKDAIEFLNVKKSLKPLVIDKLLSNACYDHVNDIGNTGSFSHEGSNKESISLRVEKYFEWDYVLCQNMDFGGKNTNEIIMSFITCDGDSKRVQRNNLFREDISFIGLSSGKHKESEIVTVIVFAGNIRELGSNSDELKNYIPNLLKKIENEKKNTNQRNIKTKFQIEDPDAPNNAISYVTYKTMKLIDGRAKHCTQKFYTLSDGTQHIVEVFEDLKVKCK